MGATYFCYVHQDSKDPITYRDPMIEAFRGMHNSITSLIDWHYRTGGDISRYFGNYSTAREKPLPQTTKFKQTLHTPNEE